MSCVSCVREDDLLEMAVCSNGHRMHHECFRQIVQDEWQCPGCGDDSLMKLFEIMNEWDEDGEVFDSLRTLFDDPPPPLQENHDTNLMRMIDPALLVSFVKCYPSG